MSNNHIYPIQLLNDIHNWFPDILYNPGRFRNVQDLLEYIRQGADTNPYTRGLQLYNTRSNSQNNPFNVRTPLRYAGSGAMSGLSIPTPTNTTTTNTSNIQRQPISTRLYETQYDIPNSSGIPITARIHTVPITSNMPNNMVASIVDTVSNQPISDLLRQMFSPDILQSFLDQTVEVYPTIEEITRATTILTAQHAQEDNCAICQDSMEELQQLRRINHCGHVFHKDCIDTWFGTNVHCPTCRYDIRETNNQTTVNTADNSPPPVPSNHRRTNIRNNNENGS
jgi:hypothetical protein